MSENLLQTFARKEWFVIEKLEYDQGYSEEGFGRSNSKEEADKECKHNNDNRGWGDNYSKVFSRDVIELDQQKSFEILRNNPLQMMKDLGFGTFTKTESIFNVIENFYNKYPDFFDVFTMQLRLPATYTYAATSKGYLQGTDTFSVPLQMAIGIKGGNTVIALMDDDQTGRIFQCAGSYNWEVIPTFHWAKKLEDSHGKELPVVPGSGLYIAKADEDKTSIEITRLGVHNPTDFIRELDDNFFKPVFDYLKKKKKIFDKIHESRPSWRYFHDKWNYLRECVRGIIKKENSKLPYWKIDFLATCVSSQFESTYESNKESNDKKNKVTPRAYLDWLEKHPDKDWGYKSFYDFCIEHKRYDLCDDEENFNGFTTNGVYTKAGQFAQKAHDLLFDREMTSHKAFFKRYINCRKGNNHSLIKKFDEEISALIQRTLDGVPTMGELREAQRKEEEAAQKRLQDKREEKRWEDFDDDD